MNWATILLNRYETTFDSPYPMEQCREILADYDLMSGIKKAFRLVDVYSQADDAVGFVIKRNLSTNTKTKPRFLSLNGQLSGTLTPTETGTRITYRVRTNQVVWSIFSAIFCVIAFLILTTPTIIITSVLGVQKIPSEGVIIVIFIGLVVLFDTFRHTRQFAQLPYALLGEMPAATPDDVRPRWLGGIHQPFHFYTNYTLPVCMKKLSQGTVEKHYRQTPLGVLMGSTSQDGYFTGYRKISNELTYFWIGKNERYPTSAQNSIFGKIQVEESHVLVSGYSRGANSGGYILFLCAVMVFLALIQPALIPILGVIGVIQFYLAVMRPAKKLRDLPADKILRDAEIPAKLGWFQRQFDFHTPYPIDDCVNMLLDYSTELGDYETNDGRGKGAVVGDLLVVIYEQDSKQYQFTILPKSAWSDPLGDYNRVIGSLEAQGHGTRVRGRLRNKWGNILYGLLLGIMLSCGLFMLISPVAIIAWAITAFLVGWVYSALRMSTKRLSNYPQDVLGRKTPRKQKLADETEQ
jgi:hypothetical protein